MPSCIADQVRGRAAFRFAFAFLLLAWHVAPAPTLHMKSYPELVLYLRLGMPLPGTPALPRDEARDAPDTL